MSKKSGKHLANGSQAPSSDTAEKSHRRRKIFSNILMIVGLVLIAISAWMFINAQMEYYKQNKAMEKLATYVQVSDSEDKPPVVDWKGLKQENSDVCAWIEIPGTKINFPVYQGKTNDTYLRTLADGSYGVGGLIFLDADNQKPGMVDPQSIIYGHHLNNGAMFAPIADMDQQKNFDKVDIVWYVTEQKAYKLKPLYCYQTSADDTNVRVFTFDSEKDFHAYLEAGLKKSSAHAANAAQEIAKIKHVLTLSTCSTVDGQGRTIFVCAEE